MEINDLVTAEIRQYKTTPNLIADALRKGIVRGVIKGGQTLRQEELAATFGVSRIPIREAFRQLEAEGLITIYPHRGAVVTELSPQEAQELYEIRLVLETTALEKAIPRLKQEDFKKAQAIIAATEGQTDISHLGELNWEFHSTLYAAAGRPRLLSMLTNLHLTVDRYMRFELAALDYLPKSQQEHSALLEACRQQEVEKAVGLLREHIESAGKLLVDYLVNSQQNQTNK
ncbi:MAG TPA: GntR family transcriptional regulator [Chloroflexia bacterium]|nr:GntR family transcriptional regulator [Chloroflexia bacterium]